MAINYDKYPTFMASSAAFSPPATPTDLFTLTGSSTKNVYVLKMGISTTQGTSGINALYALKRSTANSGGTSSNLTEVPFNANSGAATATALSYTANPTTGTLVGNLWAGWVNSPKVDTSSVGEGGIVLDFETMLGNPVALLSTSEVIAWNFGGAALPTGLSVLAWIMWCEASKS